MKFVPVESSNIKSVAYSAETESIGTIFVQYNSNKVYAYKNVPVEKLMEFLEADSKGRYLNSEIKPNYQYELRNDIIVE